MKMDILKKIENNEKENRNLKNKNREMKILLKTHDQEISP